MMEFVLKEFFTVSRLIATEGLTFSTSGNMSRIWRGKLFITRTGSNLLNLSEEDVIALPFAGSHPLDKRASSELRVHRKVLQKLGKKAMLHCHAVYSVKMSFEKDEIELSVEGKGVVSRVPVVPEMPVGSEELAKGLLSGFERCDVVVVRGHGVFAVAENLIKAYEKISLLEGACKIMWEV